MANYYNVEFRTEKINEEFIETLLKSNRRIRYLEYIEGVYFEFETRGLPDNFTELFEKYEISDDDYFITTDADRWDTTGLAEWRERKKKESRNAV